jgi:hypothetical protein
MVHLYKLRIVVNIHIFFYPTNVYTKLFILDNKINSLYYIC